MSEKEHWLVGRWETSDEDSRAVYEIEETVQGLKVQAFDKIDGEQFEVMNCKWDGESLHFDVYVESVKYRTHCVFKPVSERRAILELTLWEIWKKVKSS